MRRSIIALVAIVLSALWLLPAAAQDVAPEIQDPAGDTIDFGGSPAAGPDILGVITVEVVDFEGENAWDLFEVFFDGTSDPGVTRIVPRIPGPLLGGTGPLVLVKARLSAPIPNAGFCQIVIVFRTEGREAYSGAVGDPNNGNDTSLDIFRQSDEWMTGRTEYREGQFSFQSDYGEIAAAINGNEIHIVFPREAVPDGASWQIWVICGDNSITAGRDFADLGAFTPGVIPTVTIGSPTTTSTTTTSSATSTTSTTTTTTTTLPPVSSTLIPPTTTLAPSSEGGGGSNPLVLITITGLIIGGVGGLVFIRRRKGPCDCDAEQAAYDAALDAWEQAQYGSQAARRDADGAVTRHNQAVSELLTMEQMRPRRGEYADQASFDEAHAPHEARRAQLESDIEVLAADIEPSEARAVDAEAVTEQRFQESRAVHSIYSACLQRCFGSTTTRPPEGTGRGGSTPGAGTRGGGSGGTAPPPEPTTPAECSEPASRELEGPIHRFMVPVDGNVRVSLGTDRGPIENLEEIVTGTNIADQITDALTPDASIEIPGASLSGAGSGSWESAVTKIGSLAYNLLKREVHVEVAYDVEDVALVCVTLQECQAGQWTTVGKRLDEMERNQRTVTATWSTVTHVRPLGATFTSVRNGLAKAEDSAAQMRAFSAGCK